MNTVSHVLIDVLKDIGISYVFGIPGGNFIHILSAIEKQSDIEFILVSNESSCGFMADAVYRRTGQMAACFATFGPGACNLTTGVCGGYLDRSPMLVFTDVKQDDMIDRITQMNIDQHSLFHPITKSTERLDIHNIRRQLYQAAETALNEVPGPVHIGLPEGVTTHLVSDNSRKIFQTGNQAIQDKESAGKVISLLQKSRKPLIVLGNSCNRFSVKAIIKQFAEHHQIPVVLTPMAKGQFSEENSLYTGVLGHALSDLVHEITGQADLILGIGYDPVEINYEDWTGNQIIIHLDTCHSDSQFTNTHQVSDLTGDIEIHLNIIMNSDLPNFHWDISKIETHKKEMFSNLMEEHDPFGPSHVMTLLNQTLPAHIPVTCDVGSHMHLAGQLWKTYGNDNFLLTNGCSSMGFSIPAAIGTSLVTPDSPVCCLIGDGCFLMSCGEIATAVRLNLHLVIIIFADECLSLITLKQKKNNLNDYGTSISKKAFLSTGLFLGAHVYRPESAPEFQTVLSETLQKRCVSLIEVTINPLSYQDKVLK